MPKQYMVELAQDERDELEAGAEVEHASCGVGDEAAACTDSAGRGSRGCWPGTDGHAGSGCAWGGGGPERTCQHVRRRAVEQGPMKALERRPRPLPPVPKKAKAGWGEGRASGSGGLFGSTGRLRSVDREDAGGRAGAA